MVRNLSGRAAELGTPTRLSTWVAVLYCATVPFDPIPLAGGRTLAFPIGLILVAIVAVDFIAGRRPGRMPRSAYLILWLYLSWIILNTVAWSVRPEVSTASAVQIFIRIAVLVAIATVVPIHWRSLCSAYVVGASVLAAVVLLFGTEEYADRTTVMGADQNWLALSMAVGLSLALAMMAEYRHIKAAMILLMGLVCAFGVIATGSRTGLIALGIAVALRALAGMGSGRLLQGVLTMSVIVAAAVMFIRAGLAPSRLVEFVAGRELVDESRASVLEYYWSNPEWIFTGVGLQADAFYYSGRTGQFLYIHNLYFGTWAQLGFIGLFLLVALFVIAGRSSWRTDRKYVWVAAFGPMFAFTMTLGGQTSNVYWLVLALGLSLGVKGNDPPGFLTSSVVNTTQSRG